MNLLPHKKSTRANEQLPEKPPRANAGFPLLTLLLGAQWHKVVRDLSGNKTRTIIVILSIAVGIFAVGMIAMARQALSQGLSESYMAINPSSAMIMVSDPFFGGGGVGFDDDLVESVRGMREVADAEGRRKVTVRLQVGDDAWRDLQLFAIPDYDDIHVNKVKPEAGEWPPHDHDMLIERAALAMTQAQVGDSVTIKTPSGKLRTMQITGLTHDMSQYPAFMDGAIYGYITFDTLEWLGVSRLYNELHIVVADNKYDKAHVQYVANIVKEKVEKSGRPVYYVQVPAEPGKHPLDNIIQGIIFLLGLIGVLTLMLSGFLVVTTISAILAQHIRQIGILKSVGARRMQIMQMYFALVIAFGLCSLLLAIPTSILGARSFSQFMAHLFNFEIVTTQVSPTVIAMQVTIGLLVPLFAAFVPIWQGSRVTVREALASEGGSGSYGKGIIDRIIFKIRGMSRPLLLSLRNTFRRKGRLMLTLATLTLSGAMFISVFSIRDSLFQTLDDLMELWQYDLWITASRPYRIDQLTQSALQVPGATHAYGIGFVTTRRVRPDDTDSELLMLFAPPPESDLVHPVMVKGRWLKPDDEQAIVLSTAFVKNEPDITVGSNVVMSIDGRDTTWQVVGIVQYIAPFGFTNYPHFARVKRETGRSTTLWVITELHDEAYQSHIAQVMERHLERQGIRISSITKMAEEKAEVEVTFNIIVVLLASMAILLAFVGGLGLMGTMSINVLERTREIGIMRAIGASNGTVIYLVMVEGVLIGVFSWLLSVGVAFLLSQPLSNAAGMVLFQVPLAYAFSISGVIMWLVLVVVLSAIASALPAWNASRLTVRNVLAYE